MFRKVFAMAAVVALMSVSYASAATTVVGGPHDFSTNGTGVSTEICQPCHAPHQIQTATFALSSRLWNHELSTAQYTPRENSVTGAFNADGTAAKEGIGQVLDGVSQLCMGCHDGTIALDAFGSMTTADLGTGGTMIANEALLGTDLRANHPVGFEAIYGSHSPAPVRTGTAPNFSYKALTSTGVTLSLYKITDGTVAAFSYKYQLQVPDPTDPTKTIGEIDPVTKKAVYNGTGTDPGGVKLVVTCKTCHTPHAATPKLLNTVTNTKSVLCLACHAK